MSMRSRILIAALALAAPAFATAQAPKGVWIEWENLGVVMSPDSTGSFLWVRKGARESQDPKTFSGSFDPARLDPWIAAARRFLAQPLGASDSGQVRASPILATVSGDGIYFLRRRQNDAWSNERFLVMETVSGTDPVIVNGDERSFGEILDSLGVVGKRTPFSNDAANRALLEPMSADVDKPASVERSPLPLVPFDARRERRDGAVLLSFVVATDGTVEPKSVKTLFASAPDYLEAVRTILPGMKFAPAEKGGVKVRSRVVMPYHFDVSR
jgi:TonB family protein